ncbi:unnamed protein product [Urochloa humidicola]
MDHGGGGGGVRSSCLRDPLARMFRTASLLHSSCNATASTCSLTTAGPSTARYSPRPPCAPVAADATRDRDSFLTSSRRRSWSARCRRESRAVRAGGRHR